MNKLLLIHPDRKLHGIYAQPLASHFTVDSAFDGIQGLRLIKSLRPDIIVSDYNLPYLSGAALLRYVRSHRDLHSTPFIYLSSDHPEVEALGLGATEWLVLASTTPDILTGRCLNHLKVTQRMYV